MTAALALAALAQATEEDEERLLNFDVPMALFNEGANTVGGGLHGYGPY